MQNIKVDNKRIAKNTAFLYVRMLFVLLVSLYTTRVVLRILGVEDYGVYNVVGGFVSMFGFLNTSLAGAIQRFYNYEVTKQGAEGIQKVYITSLIIQGMISIVLLLVLESFGLWYVNNVLVVSTDKIHATNILFQCSVLSMLLVIMQVPYSAAVMSFERMDFYAIVGIIDVFLKLAIVVVLPFVPYDKLITYGVLVLFVSFVNFFLYFVYVRKHFVEMSLRCVFCKELFFSMWSFSGWNVLGTFSGVLKGQGLNMLLNAFFGPVVNAARGVSYQIMTALQQFSLNIVAAFRPQLVDSYANGNYSRTKSIVFSESKICYNLMCLLVVPVIVELRFVLRMWLGENIPPNTIPFTILVLIIMTVSTLNTPLTQVVHASGKLRAYMIVTSVITFAIVPLSWFFLKMGNGPISVFVVSLVMTIVNQIASLFVVRNMLDYEIKEYVMEVVCPCIIMTLLLPLLPFLVHRMLNESVLRLCCVCVVDFIMGCVISYSMVLSEREKQIVRSYIKRKVVK